MAGPWEGQNVPQPLWMAGGSVLSSCVPSDEALPLSGPPTPSGAENQMSSGNIS